MKYDVRIKNEIHPFVFVTKLRCWRTI